MSMAARLQSVIWTDIAHAILDMKVKNANIWFRVTENILMILRFAVRMEIVKQKISVNVMRSAKGMIVSAAVHLGKDFLTVYVCNDFLCNFFPVQIYVQ